MQTKSEYFELNGKECGFLYFNSPAHLVNTVIESKDLVNNDDERTDFIYGKHFPDFASTRDAALRGVPSKLTLKYINEVRREFQELQKVKVLMQQATSIRKRRVFQDHGDELCIDRVLTGSQEHWSKMKRTTIPKTVRLAINYCFSHTNTEKTAARMAAILAVAVELIQRAGKPVEVIGLGVSHKITDYLTGESGSIVTLKNANEPMDIQKIASVGNLGFLRCFTWSSWHKLKGNIIPDYGMSMGTTAALLERLNIQHLIERKHVEGTTNENGTELLESIFKTIN